MRQMIRRHKPRSQRPSPLNSFDIAKRMRKLAERPVFSAPDGRSVMNTKLSRRAFLAQTAGYAALASGLDLVPGRSHAADEPDWPKVADLPLTVIKGKPHERGRQYGEHF